MKTYMTDMVLPIPNPSIVMPSALSILLSVIRMSVPWCLPSNEMKESPPSKPDCPASALARASTLLSFLDLRDFFFFSFLCYISSSSKIVYVKKNIYIYVGKEIEYV